MTGYVDPRQPDPAYPGRPSHPDFADLADAAQDIDARAESGVPPLEILGLDEDSVMYLLTQRLSIMAEATGGAVTLNPTTLALYLDALTLGKVLADRRAPRVTRCMICHDTITRDPIRAWVDSTGGDVCMDNDGIDTTHRPDR
jgi:hypothetical protein